MLYSFSGTSDIVQHTDQIPPRLYVKTTYPVAIKEIILGPRFENVSEWIPHMCEQVELMCKQWDLQFPKISISNMGIGDGAYGYKEKMRQYGLFSDA